MPPPETSDPPGRRLLLRAQRTDEAGQLNSRDFFLPAGAAVRLGREPRMAKGQPGYNPDYGSDLIAFKDDKHVSNFHATLNWDGHELRVRRRLGTQNPIFVLDRSGPARSEDEFRVGYHDRFQIGTTVFQLLPDTAPLEQTCSGDELRAMAFLNPAPRIEALSALPEMIRLAPDEGQLLDMLLQVALQGVPLADVAAVVQLDATGVVTTLGARDRHGLTTQFRPSRRLVLQALQSHENVCYVWQGTVDSSVTERDAPTVAAGTDWAICLRLPGARDEGLYLAGRDSRGAAGGLRPLHLASDMKFANLAGDIFATLRDLVALQKRESFLAQLLTPVVRYVLSSGRPIEDLTAPRECPVTVLFCDLRGSVGAAERGRDNLLGSWQTLTRSLDIMTEAIVEHDGVIGDFQGDAAMGFWGWPECQDDQIERAAKAALSIRRKFVRTAAEHGSGLTGFVCGIGIAHGPAIAGKLGTRDQAKISVFGPVVNRAARLESATKALRVPILVDEAVITRLRGIPFPHGRTRRLARVLPQGLPEPVLIGELLPPEGDPGPNVSEYNRKRYEAALDRFLASDWSGFRKMLQPFPPDGPAEFMARFVNENEGAPPEGWSGGIPVTK